MQNSSTNTHILNLKVIVGDNIPSKKNYHFPSSNGGLLIDKPVKERMKKLEDAILFGLYSLCQTTENATALECPRQLRTHLLTQLNGLKDDSIREVPEFSFGVEYVEKGKEGVQIIVDHHESR